MSLLGFVLVLGVVSLLAAWIIAWPLMLGWDRLLGTLQPARALRWARWNLVVLTVPLVAGGVLALAAAGALDFHDGWAWGCHCGGEGLHLCPHHPARSAALVPFAAFILLVAAPRLIKQILLLRAGRQLNRVLLAAAPQAPADGGVHLVELGRRNAYTAGGRSPVIVADAGWWRSLTPAEQAIVRSHEHAHLRRRDPLTFSLARGLAALLPPTADALVRWWQAAAEHAADQLAGDPLEVAAFLLRQERGRAAPVLAFHGTALELRITALVDAAPTPTHPEGDLDRTLSGAVLVVVAGVLFGAELHHLTERLIAWLS